MNDDNSVEFYRRREQKERALADRAFDPHIGRIHREMAERYAALVRQAQPMSIPV